jgi:transposase
MLPYARAAQLSADLYGLSVSPATLQGWVAEASAALLETAEGVADRLRAAPVLHGDESGLRVAGKLRWLHVAATDKLTWYGVHGKRGLAAMQTQDILTRHEGVLVHDCWAPYWKLEGVAHALCNAHLLRELRESLYVSETTGQTRAQRMSHFLLDASKLRDTVRAQGGAFSPDEVQAFHAVFDDIVREGEAKNPGISSEGPRGKRSTAANLLRRFRLLPHARRRGALLRDPLRPRHPAQTGPLHVHRAATRVSRQFHPVSRVAGE